MPLRPIDAIFVHPQARYYVIYQAGKLHKLTRMKLDFSSWQRRTPYKGSEDDVYLIKNQSISDDRLSQILHTHDLPDNLHGRSLASFKLWWRMNGFRWMQEMENNPIITASQAKNDPETNTETIPETKTQAHSPTVSDTANQDQQIHNAPSDDSLFPTKEVSEGIEPIESIAAIDSGDVDNGVDDDEVMLLDDDMVVLDGDDVIDDVDVAMNNVAMDNVAMNNVDISDVAVADQNVIESKNNNSDHNDTHTVSKAQTPQSKTLAGKSAKTDTSNTDTKTVLPSDNKPEDASTASTADAKASAARDDTMNGNVDDDFFDNLLDELIK